MDEEEITHDEAFSKLSDPVRVDIVQSLGESDHPLSFTELHSLVGIRDSGRFNYHLQQLEGIFIQQTNEGLYRLNYAGLRVLGTLFAGEFLKSEAEQVVEINSECSQCNSSLQATYADEHVTIRCPDCQSVSTDFGFPQGGFSERSGSDLTSVFDAWLKNQFIQARNGLCMNCTGDFVHEFVESVEHLEWDQPIIASFRCQLCGSEVNMSIQSLLYLSENVRLYYSKHNNPIPPVEFWNLNDVFEVEINSIETDPFEITATTECDNFTGTFTIDDSLNIEVV